LIALAGCGHNFYGGERESWRHDAEVACLNSGAIKDGPDRVRISAISGPGMCGADFPIRVSALGDSGPLGYDDEPLRPPGAVPNGTMSNGTVPNSTMPQHWPVIQSNALPPPQAPSPAANPPPYGAPQTVPAPYSPAQPALAPARPAPSASAAPVPPQVAMPAAGAPMSLYAPGIADPEEDSAAFEPEPPRPYGGAPPSRSSPPATHTPRAIPPPAAGEQHEPLGPPRGPAVTGTAGPVEIKPAATLACPIVSALDQWITVAVQPAALRWFRVPVVEIKQISAYSCRGMNGNPNAHISEHAFGNALDVAEFVLADGHKITVQYGWHGSPEEQGFLHDVQLAACDEFSTVLAPGANVYHYNHIHVDLMRRASGRRICEPAAIPGEVVAERARARYAAHNGDPGVTGSIKKAVKHALGYAGDDDDRLPLAIPGED
jgi:Extensin-like protein C-terminus